MDRIFKKLIYILLFLNIQSKLYAQTEVTKFLGISIDGYKSDIINKLKRKGFTNSPYKKDVLVGEYNGRKVNLHIVTNNNKVYRIMVAYENTMNEADIKIEFNNLNQQFKNNKKYISLSDDDISEKDDISYEMTVKNKRYQAVFYQLPEKADSNTIKNEIEKVLLENFSQEQISNPNDEQKEKIIETCLKYLTDKYSKKTVWFMINEQYGQYSINIFYDNELNKASGDEL
jgi:transcriptional regulator of heat shock response